MTLSPTQEISIFEIDKKSQINTQTQSYQSFTLPMSLGMLHKLRKQEVGNSDYGKQEK